MGATSLGVRLRDPTPGVQRTVANYLNGLESIEPAEQEYGYLPDANLFFLDVTTTTSNSDDAWIKEMKHFQSNSLPPDHLMLDAKKCLTVGIQNFCLFANIMYHKRYLQCCRFLLNCTKDRSWSEKARARFHRPLVHMGHDVVGLEPMTSGFMGGTLDHYTISYSVKNIIFI